MAEGIDWNSVCDAYLSAERAARAAIRSGQRNIPAELRERMSFAMQILERLSDPSSEDIDWLIGALRHAESKWFVAALFRAGATVPEALFYPLLDAAIDESDPSFNQYFVTPCVKTFGPRRANEYLLSVLESGATRRKAGAVQALYWADVGLSFPRTVPAYTPEYATAESRKAYDNFSDMRNRKNLLYLETFVSDTDLGVRRSIIPGLDLDPNAYPESHREMLTRAISIARESTDDYIRHRVEVQLGARVPLKPRPPLQ